MSINSLSATSTFVFLETVNNIEKYSVIKEGTLVLSPPKTRCEKYNTKPIKNTKTRTRHWGRVVYLLPLLLLLSLLLSLGFRLPR